MKGIRIRRRWKVLAAGLLALACIFVSFNIWFIQNTNSIIESLVRENSNGKLELQLSKSKFNYFNKKIELYGATFYSADTVGDATTYRFTVQKLDLKLRSLWRFMAFRELLIDSINLKAPEVTVTRLSRNQKERTDVSIPEEIGRIYNSILDALQVLNVKRFGIDDGKFNLVNKMDPGAPTTTISNIHFHINNLRISGDSTETKKFLYSDNVVLQVRNQEVTLPDGIHRMSFKNLVINVRQKQVQVDSCWLRAATRTGHSSFRIFFNVLKMANLDFNALYAKNLIKADSVYINDPDIELALDITRKKERSKKLELDTIIQQFTGDLALGYIGVQNATVNIVANRGDTTTTFSTANDNFKMFGLRVNSDSAKPVYVDAFTMVLRQYETYSRDSSAVYRFDSLRFTNNKVRLSNFTIQSIAGRQSGSLYYSIPAFELTGLSWEDLLFDRYISAEKAVLLNPDIQYTIGASKKKAQKTSLFKVLSGLNEAISLNQIEIQNGNLNIQLPAGKRLNLQQVDMVLASNRLLASTSYTGMQQAIDQLAFRTAVFTTGDLRAELHNLQYSDHLYADALHLTNKAKTIEARATGITLNDLVWNNTDKSVFVDHLAWRQAAITLKPARAKSRQKATSGTIALNGFSGANTLLTIYAGDKTLKTRLSRFKLDDFIKRGAEPLLVKGAVADGNGIEVTANAFTLTSGAYHLADGAASTIHALSFLQQSVNDTVRVAVPQTFLKPHIEDLVRGKLAFGEVTLQAPVVTRVSTGTATQTQAGGTALPYISIAALAVQSPTVHYIKQDTAATSINWLNGGNNKNNWTFYNIHTGAAGLRIDKADLSGNKILYSRGGKQFGIDSGYVHLVFKNIHVNGADSVRWQAQLQEALFKNPISLALKKTGGIGVDELRLRNLTVSSQHLKNIYGLLQKNPALQLTASNGSFAAETTSLQWKMLSYNQANRSLSLDSFSFKPTLSRDSAIAKAPGQTDYMYGVLKNITAEEIDLTALEEDSIFNAKKVTLTAPELNIYRDKRKPFLSQKLRPLPAAALQAMGAKFSIDTVALKDATVSYTEMNAKTAQEGTIFINRINAQLFPVRNVGIGATDSLALRAEGYVMDSAWLRLRFKQSYTDSLGTFAMTLRMKPTALSVLNPALMPLASVKLLSGDLDTITMRAVGHEYFAIGQMNMYYKNLKIQFLKKGSETKKTVLTSLITFAANNFVIKKHNTNRTGTVYFLRNRDRSVFNFLIKTALSGIASSVGAKKNKKYQRQYKKQQKLYNLPPVEFS